MIAATKGGKPVVSIRIAGFLALVVVLAAPAVVHPQAGERAETILWSAALKSSNADDIRAYLDKYPNGIYADAAKRRLATLALEKRAEQPTEWEGFEYFTRGTYRAAKPAQPDERDVNQWTFSLKMDPKGTCLADNTMTCTWVRTGNAVTVKIPKAKDVCETTYELQMSADGTRMTGTHYLKETRSCRGGATYVDISLHGARRAVAAPPPASAPPVAVPKPAPMVTAPPPASDTALIAQERARHAEAISSFVGASVTLRSALADRQAIANIRVNTNCAMPIDVALRFQALDGQWVTTGWWTVQPNQPVVTNALTSVPLIYYYAESSGRGQGAAVIWTARPTDEGATLERVLPFPFIRVGTPMLATTLGRELLFRRFQRESIETGLMLNCPK